jgi:hypothetical protein
MLFATVGDILSIRKEYQATFKFNSDESTTDQMLTCLDFNKLMELCLNAGENEVTGNMLASFLRESLIDVPMEAGDNFIREINDPVGGRSIIGYSGKDKYDLMNHYEPESLDDRREYDDPIINIPKSKTKSKNNQYNKTRITTTGRKAKV